MFDNPSILTSNPDNTHLGPLFTGVNLEFTRKEKGSWFSGGDFYRTIGIAED